MSRFETRLAPLTVTTAFAMFLSIVPAAAQPGGFGWGPGMMMGPGMMQPGGMWGGDMCNPRSAGLAEWRIARIERAVRPTDAQRPKLEELKTASTKAAETINAACPRELPASPVARLELAEKRLNAMLEAVKIVRPKFEDFYASLTSEQQGRLNSASPRQWGWRWWRWRE
jgi:LTXXQ motif family protein